MWIALKVTGDDHVPKLEVIDIYGFVLLPRCDSPRQIFVGTTGTLNRWTSNWVYLLVQSTAITLHSSSPPLPPPPPTSKPRWISVRTTENNLGLKF